MIELLNVLAWPATVLAAVSMLRRPFVRLVDRVRVVRSGANQVHLDTYTGLRDVTDAAQPEAPGGERV